MKSDAYWLRRALARMLDIELMGNGYVERIMRLYLQATAQIESDMLHLFRRYRDQGALTPEEAAELLREPVDRATWEILRQQIEAVTDLEQRRRLIAEMNAASVKARLDRQQAMLLDLRTRCAQLAQQEIPLHTEAYQQTADEAYLHTVFDTLQEAADKAGADPQTGELPAPEPSIPVGGPVAPLPRDAIDDLLAQRWSGKNFSERIWGNTEVMADQLAETMRTNMTTGRSWRRCLDEMQAFAATPGRGGLYAVERLLRTEQNFVANQMALRAMREMGAKYYRYIATLDDRTSEICQAHDGRIDPDTGKPYEVAKAKPGVNIPPLHPHCRSAISPVVDGEVVEGLQRAARDPETGKTVMVPAEMTYPEWMRSVLSQPGVSAATKERLLGGKKKRILFDAGVLEPDDYTTPWKELEKRGIIIPNDSVVEHSDLGDFRPPSKDYPQVRFTGGGHGERCIAELDANKIDYHISTTYPNGVRAGYVPSHKETFKRKPDGQAWFPASWSKDDILLAGTYVANKGMSVNASYGTAKEAMWQGVNVRVNFLADGKIDTICPSFNQ